MLSIRRSMKPDVIPRPRVERFRWRVAFCDVTCVGAVKGLRACFGSVDVGWPFSGLYICLALGRFRPPSLADSPRG